MKSWKYWLIPVVGMLFLAPFTPYLDLGIAGFFHKMCEKNIDHFITNDFTDFMYIWGIIPAQMVFLGTLIGYLFSFLIPKLKSARVHFLFLFLVLAIGSGFVTNWVLKDHWGRARPKQLARYGGTAEFRAFYEPNIFGENYQKYKSFPCGHCTMGFYFLAFVPLGWRLRSRSISLLGWIVGLGLGFLIGFSRMAEGGHFLSDVLSGGLVMWLSALAVDYLVYEDFV